MDATLFEQPAPIGWPQARYLTPLQVGVMQQTLLRYMDRHGMTRADVAKQSGMLSASAVATALRSPKCTTMLAQRIAHAVGMVLGDLVGPPELPSPPEEVPGDPPVCHTVVNETPDIQVWLVEPEDRNSNGPMEVCLQQMGSPFAPIIRLYGEGAVDGLIRQLETTVRAYAYEQGYLAHERFSS